MEKKPTENGHIDNVTKNDPLEECDQEKVEVLKVRKKTWVAGKCMLLPYTTDLAVMLTRKQYTSKSVKEKNCNSYKIDVYKEWRNLITGEIKYEQLQ